MVDLHTHILFDMDDGAKTIYDSQKLIELQNNISVNKIALTSHFYPREETIESFLERRKNSYSEFSKIFGDCKIEFKIGSEVYMSSILLNVDDISPLCCEGTNYLLLELPFTRPFSTRLFDNLEKLILNKDVIPIIAHIERYNAVEKDQSIIDKLIDMGCIIQMNASTIINKSTRRHSLKLIKKGKIHVIASDCHSVKHRPPNILEAYNIIEKKLGKDTCYSLQNNAEKIFIGTKLHENTEESLILF